MNKIKKIKQKDKSKETKVYKKRIFRTFVFWYSIPTSLKSMTLTQLKDIGFDTSNKVLKELIKIKSQTEFAKHFDVSIDTLTRWKRRKTFKKQYNKLCDQNILKFKKDIDYSFTEKTIRTGDAPRVKLWKQLYEGWIEKKVVEQTGSLNVLLNEIAKKKEPLVKT